MNYLDEGYIKFNCEWVIAPALPLNKWQVLNEYRAKMYEQKWIGYYEEHQVGYGNISCRFDEKQFIISGTQTGHLAELGGGHYTLVRSYDIAKNSLLCLGPIKASSESLTHAAIYELNPSYQAVIHIHDKKLWKSLMNKVPTSSSSVPYGTPEMAYEILRLYKKGDLAAQRLLVMGGHEEGIIAFGESLEEAAKILFLAEKL